MPSTGSRISSSRATAAALCGQKSGVSFLRQIESNTVTPDR
jgi:hypothetical protein